MAIWGCFGDDIGTDIPPGAAAVFNQKGLAEPIAQSLGQKTRNNVVRSARREGYDQAYRSLWPTGLRQNAEGR
jgi:hypothetical protein